MTEVTRPEPLEVPDEIIARWQKIIDIAAELMNVPAALIMRIARSDIEVFVAGSTGDNPYTPGAREHLLGSGLYCETVVKTKQKLLVPNALKDDDWKSNPDVKLNMISYLGFPILMPDGTPFGTICVLDNKENRYTSTFEQLLDQFRYVVESHVGLLYMNRTLGDENRRLSDYISEIKVLRGLLPVCSLCKKIREDDGSWCPIERYVSARSDARFTHTFCPECAAEWQKEQGIG